MNTRTRRAVFFSALIVTFIPTVSGAQATPQSNEPVPLSSFQRIARGQPGTLLDEPALRSVALASSSTPLASAPLPIIRETNRSGDDDANVAWTRLGARSKMAKVKMFLRDGRVLKGTIQIVEAESLGFAEGGTTVTVRRAEIRSGYDGFSRGKSVELHLSDGAVVTGLVRSWRDDDVDVFVPGKMVQVNREDIRRIRQKSRWRGALIGMGIGAVGGAIIGATDGNSSPQSPSSQSTVPKSTYSRNDHIGEAVGMFAIFGAGIGALIGVPHTLYENKKIGR